ncbi:MAG: cell division protein ZapA [Bacteroidetes bacterium]|jgi:cell division protein ZapA|nr:cell division protein ZapA [Bacteroidota bacterium]
MDKYQIQLEILSKRFPINVTQEEEPRIRLVGQYIQDKIEGYQQRYPGLKDETYLAIMACMDIAAEHLKMTEAQEQMERELAHRLQTLDGQLDFQTTAPNPPQHT